MKNQIVAIFALAIVTAAGSASASANKNPPAASYAPIPPQIAAAKTIFLSNRCEEDYKTCAEVYNGLYTALSSFGKYQLVSSPATADLIFEIHMVARTGTMDVLNGEGHSNAYSNLTLAILDTQTHIGLWTITEPFAKNTAVKAVMFDLQIITQPNATAAPPQHVPGYTKD
ncbi:hypothetical protein RBB79_11900 [Tunturiibacter empetritectus]|uniref:Uncharacterized protein n=2 Tax=Tunturiibacter TaxID=3154218 RepID=A0A852VL56_9BACT|nr:hypothetical protein [Edaphobacter lichenicola]NYF90286.1 hypothetical protein [Edaphobacter lichenicola]